jgi:c-di-GMP-binding flagellar brake protein YcgR
MFDDLGQNAGSLSEGNAAELLRELEQNTPEEIRRQRKHFRVSIKAGITVQPGSASEAMRLKVRGTTGDVSEGGLGALLPLPLGVGDVYRLEFDRDKLDLPLMFARCVRCRLVREEAYESGFTFFSLISIPDNLLSAREV